MKRSFFLKSIATASIAPSFIPSCFAGETQMEDNDNLGKLIYENPLKNEQDIKGFKLEGEAKISFTEGGMRMKNNLDPSLGQKSNFVFWCPIDFPSDFAITWNFKPIKEPGLCILFFAAAGKNGEDLFDPKLAKREGVYDDYHHGDINALHLSYFRRRFPDERAFNLCNLRKSYGFHMVSQAADPIPSVPDVTEFYKLKLIKRKNKVSFFINDLPILTFIDDGKTYGPLLKGGKIGFRQMAPLVAEYNDIKVYEV